MMLRPWTPALAATCLALLSGAAVNQDGRSSSLTAPNGPAQQAVMRQALAGSSWPQDRHGTVNGGVPPSHVIAISMHGTGTPLGDPIEVGAAAAVLRPLRCISLLSSKSQFGHGEPAAGEAPPALSTKKLDVSPMTTELCRRHRRDAACLWVLASGPSLPHHAPNLAQRTRDGGPVGRQCRFWHATAEWTGRDILLGSRAAARGSLLHRGQRVCFLGEGRMLVRKVMEHVNR